MLTICTCTYNRGYLLSRPFESLKAQTKKAFIGLVVDDGSTDDTEKIMKEFIKSDCGFEIRYYKKNNGGRHTALNYSYRYIDTEYVLNLDSDDALLENAVEVIVNKINELKELGIDDKYWQISFRNYDSKTGKIVGDLYPNNINTLSGVKQRKEFLKVKGEKHNCRKAEVLKKYPFPEYEGLKFIPENIVWDVINREYDTYCTNDVISLYYQDSADSLSSGGMHSESNHISIYYYHMFVFNNLMDEFFYNPLVRRCVVTIPRHAILGGISLKKVLSDINSIFKKIPVACCYFLLLLAYKKESDKA